MSIRDYGWTIYRSAVNNIDTMLTENKGLLPGRVVTESAQYYKVRTDRGENWAVLTGSLLNSFAEKSHFPTVGDWLLVDPDTGHEHWIIRKVLPRYSSLSRKVAGDTTEPQMLAVNIDWVFIVNSLDGGRNFNPRGIERYVTTAREGGAQPVVILNKADLCDDTDAKILEAKAVAPGVPVLSISAVTGSGFEKLSEFLSSGRTVVLAGRSGVGKSSIINQLAGEQLMDTGKQREQDRRGRHTTTRRQLLRLQSGALLIDTPGLRELALWADRDGVNSAFPEIDALAASCRFSDCTHLREPGCAVREGVESGEIEKARYESFLALQREVAYLRSRQDEKSRRAYYSSNKARGKELARHVKDIKKHGKRR